MKKFEHGGNIYGKNIRLDFSVNINPLGIDERIKNAAIGASTELYPDAQYNALREAIAGLEGTEADNIVCSNGASEMIFAVTHAIRPKRALLVSPTFSEYERALRSIDCKIDYYELSEENCFRIGEDFAEVASRYDMVFVCNPNNPTGTVCDRSVFEKISDRTVCVVDECFMDLAEGYSMKGRLPVIKAFTKTYAMAGLRLGYLIADRSFCDSVRRQLPAWNVSAPAAAAGAAAASSGDYLARSIELIRRERKYLTEALKKIGFKVFPSDANFILVKGREGIGEALLKRGILIRECGNFRSLDARFYRIAVKTHAENEILIKELGEECG